MDAEQLNWTITIEPDLKFKGQGYWRGKTEVFKIVARDAFGRVRESVPGPFRTLALAEHALEFELPPVEFWKEIPRDDVRSPETPHFGPIWEDGFGFGREPWSLQL